MPVQYSQFPSMLKNAIEITYESIKDEGRARSFYFDFLHKQVVGYAQAAQIKEPPETIEHAVKAFLKEKIIKGEIAPRYTVQCIACRKKLLPPVSSLNDLPEKAICPHCHAETDFENDYLYYDLRYFFA